MFRLRLVAATAIAAAATLLSAGAAQAYPDPPITIKIDGAILYGGNSFSYTASSGDVNCDWTITYADGVASGESPTQTGNGTSISGTYKTKVVSKTFKSPLTALCTYDDGTKTGAVALESTSAVTPAIYLSQDASALQAATRTASASATVTLLPRGASTGDNDNAGLLPDTGGSNLWILVLGGALVVGGAGTVYATRRRQHTSR